MPTEAANPSIGKDFQPPVNVQFSVFLDNRVGQLLNLLDIFQDQALRVAAIAVNDATDHAVIRLLTSRHELARRLLQRHQMPFSENEVLVAELDGRHDLVSVCTLLLNAEVNVHYAYPLLVQPRRHPGIALHTDDQVLACQLLRRRMVNLLAENDLGENATGSDPLNSMPDN